MPKASMLERYTMPEISLSLANFKRFIVEFSVNAIVSTGLVTIIFDWVTDAAWTI